MATLQASIYIEQGNVTLLLNGKIILNTPGEYKAELTKDTEYILQWFAEGRTGSQYSITVWSPREAEFQLMHVLGETGKDFGGTRFSI